MSTSSRPHAAPSAVQRLWEATTRMGAISVALTPDRAFWNRTPQRSGEVQVYEVRTPHQPWHFEAVACEVLPKTMGNPNEALLSALSGRPQPFTHRLTDDRDTHTFTGTLLWRPETCLDLRFSTFANLSPATTGKRRDNRDPFPNEGSRVKVAACGKCLLHLPVGTYTVTLPSFTGCSGCGASPR